MCCGEKTYDIGSVTLNGKDDDCAGGRADNGPNGPEQGHAVQHLAESFAGLVAQVEALTELGATRAVDCADVLNVCVDTGAEGGASWQGRDTAWSRDLHDAEDIDEEQLDADGEEHGGRRHGENTDRGVVGAGTAEGC